MAIRNIIQVGDETLRKKCFEVTDFGPKTWQLIDDMKDTLFKADGAGLAAPQVGVLRRIFIVYAENKYYECINPVMVKQSGKQSGEEGCLSIKGQYGVVERPMKVTVKALDRFGKPFTVKAEGFTARAFCHEYDHLDGILYTDKAISVSKE
ncbi:MAG: peptide deformylase [Candidatus Borkfalkiaceae bacterium]|nr:peptide deformylase [Christensenellaceae bacterium]